MQKELMQMTLAKLCEVVAERWQFDGKNYEELARTQAQVSAHEYEALRLAFAVRHIHAELSEAIGQIGRFSEKLDHQTLSGKTGYLLESADGRRLLAMHAKTLLLNLARFVEVASLDEYLAEEFLFWASKHRPENERGEVKS